MLENQNLQLVQGLQELYRRVQNGEGWTGAPLKETNGTPLTNDILERLGALKQEGQADSAHFEEDFEALQDRLLANNDRYSEADLPPMLEPAVHYKPTFTNPYASHLSPTPSVGGPHPSIIKTSSPLKTRMNTSASQFMQQSQSQTEPFQLEGMGYSMSYESPSFGVNMQAMTMAAQMSAQMYQDSTGTAINPCKTMKNWHGLDSNMHQYFQGVVYT